MQIACNCCGVTKGVCVFNRFIVNSCKTCACGSVLFLFLLHRPTCEAKCINGDVLNWKTELNRMALEGRVCIVTGASRGIGKGIALQLGEAGATVYITGRTLKNKDGTPGSLEETAKEIESRGGKCIPVQCDHAKDEDVSSLFERIKTEQNGRLDVLVNNAYAAVTHLFTNTGRKFWDIDCSAAESWDIVNNVGLRNHYICTIEAAKMMVPRQSGLIVNVSSLGGLRYILNVPYGVGKAACDRMAADCAIELRRSKVAMVSLWPGAVQTETLMGIFTNPDTLQNKIGLKVGGQELTLEKSKQMVEEGESIEYAGKAVVGLATDHNIMSKSGKIVMTTDLADEYKFTDIDGKVPGNMRSIKYVAHLYGWKKTSYFIPGWLRLPHFMLTLAGHKF